MRLFRRKKSLAYADVVWCFAHLLGRHPRSTAEATRYLDACGDFRDLVGAIVAMPEFATRRAVASEGFVYDDSPDVQRAVLEILRRLEPVRAAGVDKIRIGRERDSGYVMLDDFAAVTAAYSVGIGNEVSWDLAIAERGIEVHQYDHTIDGPPCEHPRFHWSKTGLGPDVTADLETLPRLLEANGHQGRNDLLFKCDIEGCEWQVLAGLPPETLRHFRQIVIELHDIERLPDPAFSALVARAIGALTADHRVVHVHANNHRPYGIVGGIPLPAVLELTLVRAADFRLVATDEVFPQETDSPCYPGRADFRLGTFRF